MSEMGTVDLLTREGEIKNAKRIEEGMRDFIDASVHYPGIVQHIIDLYEQVKSEDKKLSELLTGFLEEMEEVPSAGPLPLQTPHSSSTSDPPHRPEQSSTLPKQSQLPSSIPLPPQTPHSSKIAGPFGVPAQSSQSSPLLSAATQPQSLSHAVPPHAPVQSSTQSL